MVPDEFMRRLLRVEEGLNFGDFAERLRGLEERLRLVGTELGGKKVAPEPPGDPCDLDPLDYPTIYLWKETSTGVWSGPFAAAYDSTLDAWTTKRRQSEAPGAGYLANCSTTTTNGASWEFLALKRSSIECQWRMGFSSPYCTWSAFFREYRLEYDVPGWVATPTGQPLAVYPDVTTDGAPGYGVGYQNVTDNRAADPTSNVIASYLASLTPTRSQYVWTFSDASHDA